MCPTSKFTQSIWILHLWNVIRPNRFVEILHSRTRKNKKNINNMPVQKNKMRFVFNFAINDAHIVFFSALYRFSSVCFFSFSLCLYYNVQWVQIVRAILILVMKNEINVPTYTISFLSSVMTLPPLKIVDINE